MKKLLDKLKICVCLTKRFLTQRPSVSIIGILVENDFTSKLAIARFASNSSTSLANEKKYFLIYSLMVTDMSSLPQDFANVYVVVHIADCQVKSLYFILQKPMNFVKSLVLNLIDIYYGILSLKFHFAF